MSNRKIYALLVGIDKYQPPIPALDGCVNDMNAMLEYLRRYSFKKGIEFFPLSLTNQEATRFNIVEKFEAHLGQAGEDDVALFYYSGHGSQEHAHEVFWEIESDQKNETLVCYDSRLPDGMDLADKELATLIDIVAQNNPHILTIIDACNSGSATRSTNSYTKARLVEGTPKLSDNVSPRVRMPQSYILPRNFQTERALGLDTDPDELIIPNPRHVALSAARSFQLAKETYLDGQPRGVFTYSLIEVLESTVGRLSYNDLMRRVRSLVTQRTYEQNPELDAAIPEDINLEFLDGLTTLTSNYFSVQYESGEGWTIDGGSIHGIVPPNFAGQTTRLSIYPENATESEMLDNLNALGVGIVTTVLSGKSKFDLEGNLSLEEGKVYKAQILDIPVEPLYVFINTNDSTKEKIKEAYAENNKFKTFLEFVEEEGDAQYQLNQTGGKFILSRSSDPYDLPLATPIDRDDEVGIRQSLAQLAHIAQWERVKNLSNAGSHLSSESVKIELIDPNTDQAIPSTYEGFVFHHNAMAGQKNQFKIRLTNVSGKKLFCVLAYFDAGFQVQAGLLNVNGLWMEPGDVAWAVDGQRATATMPDNLFQLGLTHVDNYLKVIFSTREMNPTLLNMSPIERMEVPRSTASTHRGLVFSNRDSNSFDDWNSNELSFRIERNG
ncbi:MAG: caspase family protein [Bacteroidia bacterium]|nr:caspase family protein [Bacteroidia bacterium]